LIKTTQATNCWFKRSAPKKSKTYLNKKRQVTKKALKSLVNQQNKLHLNCLVAEVCDGYKSQILIAETKETLVFYLIP